MFGLTLLWRQGVTILVVPKQPESWRSIVLVIGNGQVLSTVPAAVSFNEFWHSCQKLQTSAPKGNLYQDYCGLSFSKLRLICLP